MRITLVASSYPEEKIGGAEYQTLLIGQGLAALGHQVAFLAATANDADAFRAGRMEVRTFPGWRKTGWRRHRQAIAQAIGDYLPDLCYVRAFPELGIVIPLCKGSDVPVVSASSNMRETSPLLVGNHPLETVAFLRSGRAFLHASSFLSIRHTAAHVCNTMSLLANMRRWYPKKPMSMIYNGSPVPPLRNPALDEPSGQVIWVNNIKRLKRPEIFIRLAHHLPQYRFVMIGRMPGSRIHSGELRALMGRAPNNFTYLGPQPLDQVNKMIGQSDLLLYTSLPVEGFGNSFMQAWFRGVPTVSFSYELDGILEREGIGRCTGTFGQLVSEVKRLMTDHEARREMGSRARDYAVRQHGVETMVTAYEQLFESVPAGA